MQVLLSIVVFIPHSIERFLHFIHKGVCLNLPITEIDLIFPQLTLAYEGSPSVETSR